MRGFALCIGLNSVDPDHYGGWSGDLNACEADAEDMSTIAKTQKFDVHTLLTKTATREKVTDEIRRASRDLKSADILLLSYSGHGGQLPDLNSDESDAMDETWCLYNGELIDDELYSLLGEFVEGVRIFVLSDSCHSGTVTKLAYYAPKVNILSTNVDINGTKYRFIPADVSLRTYRKNREFYDQILKNDKLRDSQDAIKASCLLISGCQDNQLSLDGAFNGLFTSQLLSVWKEGTFKGNYKKFHQSIVKRMPPDQTPNLYTVGQINRKFETQKPFSI